MNRQRPLSFARRLFGSASWWRRSRQRGQLRPKSIGSRQVASSYPGRLLPQRHRRCLRVLILEFAFTPRGGLNSSGPYRPFWGSECGSFRPFKQRFDYIAAGSCPTGRRLRCGMSGRFGREPCQKVAVNRAASLLERNVTRRLPISQPLVRALPRESDGPPELLLGDRNSRPHSLCGSLDLG